MSRKWEEASKASTIIRFDHGTIGLAQKSWKMLGTIQKPDRVILTRPLYNATLLLSVICWNFLEI